MSQSVAVALDCDRCRDGRIVARRGERLQDLRARAAADGWSLGSRGPRARVECPAPHALRVVESVR